MMKGSEIELPPGFRFHPTDEELVEHYLCRKCAGLPIAVPIIAEINLYKFDPWQLPKMALYGEKEWYFFSPRDRKYPNGSRPNRAAGVGYWKATGSDKPIGKLKALAIKKALVFYAGKAPIGMKTNWIMHEYRPANVYRPPAGAKKNLRLDDWVLCRLYNKKGRMEKHYPTDQTSRNFLEMEKEKKRDMKMTLPLQPQPSMINYPLHMNKSESKLQTDSSSLEHVLSPEIVTFDKEVRSEGKWNIELENGFNEFELNYLGNLNSSFQIQDHPFAPQANYQMGLLSPSQDISMIAQQNTFSF